MDQILDEIEKALKRKGISAAAASKQAAGHYSLIKNMKASKADGKRYSVETLEKLADVLDLELYFGPPRETGAVAEIRIKSQDFAAIPRFDAQLAAGAGRINHDKPPIEHLAFSRDWLKRMGVSPDKACLLGVEGNSMEPALHSGDLVLIDQRKKAVRDRRVYAFTDIDGLARIKRLELVHGKMLVLRSDNPDCKTEFRTGPDMNRVQILGEVVWSGHVWK